MKTQTSSHCKVWARLPSAPLSLPGSPRVSKHRQPEEYLWGMFSLERSFKTENSRSMFQ